MFGLFLEAVNLKSSIVQRWAKIKMQSIKLLIINFSQTDKDLHRLERDFKETRHVVKRDSW